jgi:DNA-binding beta-propeller fold protein YncE
MGHVDKAMNRREFVALAAAAPFAARSLLAAAPSALVTCDAESRLAVVDLGSFTVVHSIPTLPDPRSVELVGSQAVVCHTAVGAISIVDSATRRVRHVLRDLVEPRYTAAHPDGVHAFVTDSGHSSVVAVDVVRGRVLGRVRLREWARHLSIDAAGRTLWVGLGSASPDLAIVDVSSPARPRHAGTVTPPFAAHDVGFAPGGHVWVTSGSRGELGVFDRQGRAVVRLPADLAPQHVTFGADVAYVTSGDSGTLRVQRLADGKVLRTTPIEVGSYNVQQGFGRVLTASLSRGTLTVLDRRGALLARIQVAGSCHDACFLRS